MQSKPHLESVEPESSVATETKLSLGEIDMQANRLRSWALIRGATISGDPFLRVQDDAASVNLPVSGSIEPHSETGLALERTKGAQAVIVEDVPFEQIHHVIEDLRREVDIADSRAAVEFRPQGRDFHRGTIVWRLASPSAV